MTSPPAGRRRLWSGGLTAASAVAALGAVLCWSVLAYPLAAQDARAPAPTDSQAQSAAPERPSDPVAAKAYAALERLCAGCHQADRLPGPYARPAAAIADILDLARIAADGRLVRPGVADASQIYDMMLRRHAPVPLEPEAVLLREPPTPDELKALRDWLDQLPAGQTATCAGRPFLTPEDTTAAIEQALAATPEADRAEVRFVSLAPLYNSCADAAEMKGYTEAVATLLNGLSWAPSPVTLHPVGPGGALLKIDLAELGWRETQWAILADAFPYAGLPATSVPPTVVAATKSQLPLLPADWLAAAAMQPPLYYALAEVPGQIAELEGRLHVDARDLDVRGAAVRAAVRPSAVTRSDRIVERLPARYGSLWRSYDFVGGEGWRNLLEHPLGPAGAVRTAKPFRHDGSKVMFTSPNGSFKFGLFGPDGARLPASPPELERDRAVTGAMAAGLACQSCHRSGPIRPVDALRREAAEGRIPESERAGVLLLHAEQASMDTLVEEDRVRLRSALRAAGIDPDRTIRGLEPVTALAASYLRGGGLLRAAAEYGRPPEAFVIALDSAPEAAQAAARRLQQGPLPRRDLTTLLRQLAGASATPTDTAAGGDGLKPARPSALSIIPSADRFRPGDLASFTVRSEVSCHLTLIGVDSRGIATVLYPNDFEPDSLLLAGKELRVPEKTAGYQFRARDEGREMVIGLCSPTARAVAGIEHDFERQRFTLLGDWKVFVAESLEITAKPAAAKPAPSEPARNARRRGREPPREAATPDIPPMTLVDAPERSVVTYEVRARP